MKLSVIIPIGFKEKQLNSLLDQLRDLPKNSEIILVTSDEDNLKHIETNDSDLVIKKILSASGRARSMNLGSDKATGEFLWFLHADSKLDNNSISSLLKAIDKNPEQLLYFNLAFYDGPKLMKINEWGVRFRTYFLKTPFGDQGLCIRKDIFSRLGKYPENVACGEDHLLVRQARRKNIKLMRIKSNIYTSGRKYEANGWVKTTILHLYLSVKQAHEDNKKHRRA